MNSTRLFFQIQQLETQVIDAEKRAFTAQQQVGITRLCVSVSVDACVQCVCVRLQVQWMEDQLNAPDNLSGDSEVRLFRRCQELQALLQEKEDVVAQLGQQLEEQVKNWGGLQWSWSVMRSGVDPALSEKHDSCLFF